MYLLYFQTIFWILAFVSVVLQDFRDIGSELQLLLTSLLKKLNFRIRVAIIRTNHLSSGTWWNPCRKQFFSKHRIQQRGFSTAGNTNDANSNNVVGITLHDTVDYRIGFLAKVLDLFLRQARQQFLHPTQQIISVCFFFCTHLYKLWGTISLTCLMGKWDGWDIRDGGLR